MSARTEQVAEQVDLIVDGWYVVTMNATRDIIRNGAVAVRDGVIVAVGKAADIHRGYAAARTIGSGCGARHRGVRRAGRC